MDRSEVLFPYCGITLSDVLSVAAKADNKRHAAKLLGVSERQFCSVIKDRQLGHLFSLKKPRKIKVSPEDIIELAQQGFIRRDVAFMLGVSPAYLKKLILKWKLQDAFTVRHGYASWVCRRGYCNA
jgi:hypothetical protein